MENFDFTFFFNANILFNDFVDDFFLPEKNQLLVVKHPGLLMSNRSNFPYETNEYSTCYIPGNKGEFYFMGGVNGGDSKKFNRLIVDLKNNVEIDLSKKIIAKWHDESHLNYYMLNANYKILSEDYIFIEHNYHQKTPKIIIRDKNTFGGHNYLRNLKTDSFTRSKILIKGLLKKLLIIWK